MSSWRGSVSGRHRQGWAWMTTAFVLGREKKRFFLRTEYETCVEDSAAALFRRKGKPSARGDGTGSPQVLSVKEQEKARERVERQHAELLPQELLAWENGMWWGWCWQAVLPCFVPAVLDGLSAGASLWPQFWLSWSPPQLLLPSTQGSLALISCTLVHKASLSHLDFLGRVTWVGGWGCNRWPLSLRLCCVIICDNKVLFPAVRTPNHLKPGKCLAVDCPCSSWPTHLLMKPGAMFDRSALYVVGDLFQPQLWKKEHTTAMGTLSGLGPQH